MKKQTHSDYITNVISSKIFATKRTQIPNTITKNSKNPFKILHINDHVLDLISSRFDSSNIVSRQQNQTHTHSVFYSSEYQGLIYQLSKCYVIIRNDKSKLLDELKMNVLFFFLCFPECQSVAQVEEAFLKLLSVEAFKQDKIGKCLYYEYDSTR